MHGLVPSFSMLKAFDAFGKYGGVRKAALALGVDHAMVSRHLAALEAYVGTALVERKGNTRVLTADGVEYHRRVSAAFQEIANATLVLRKRDERQLLIWCSPGLAYHWLASRLAAFRERGISIELRPMDYQPDFSTNEADGDIRYVRNPSQERAHPDTKFVDIARPPVFPVASPVYAESVKARIGDATAFLDLRLLHEENDLEWRAWFATQGVEIPPSTLPGPRMWHAHVMLEAARAGEGVALANPFLVSQYLANGQLVRLSARETPLEEVSLGSYQFTTRVDRWNSPPVARFRNWLLEQAATSN